MGRIFLYSLESKQATPVTDGWFAVGNPEFSSDGKLLFFVSARSFNPTYGQTEFQHVYNDMSKIYFVTLAKDTKSPLAPRSDEVKIKEEPKPPMPAEPKAEAGAPSRRTDQARRDKKEEPKKEEPKKDAGPTTKVDLDGIVAPHRGRCRRRPPTTARCGRWATGSTTGAAVPASPRRCTSSTSTS